MFFICHFLPTTLCCCGVSEKFGRQSVWERSLCGLLLNDNPSCQLGLADCEIRRNGSDIHTGSLLLKAHVLQIWVFGDGIGNYPCSAQQKPSLLHHQLFDSECGHNVGLDFPEYTTFQKVVSISARFCMGLCFQDLIHYLNFLLYFVA